MMHPVRGRFLASLSVACLLLLSCSEALTTSDSDVDRVVVNPASVSLIAGESRPTTAQVFDTDGQRIVDRAVFWSSQNLAVATVSQSGVITAVGSGNTQVAASAGGKSGIVSVSVTDRPVTLVRVVPSTASVQTGGTVPLAADALDASGAEVPGRPVSWATNRSNVAMVSTGGVVSGVAPGTATITATVDGIDGSATITVSAVPAASVTVAPPAGTVVQGGALQLSATVRDAQGNTLAGRAVTWSSSEESIATVSSTGRVVGVSEGSFTITATSEGVSGSGTYSVTRIPVGLVRLSPAAATIAVGQTQPLTVSLFAADKTTPLPLAGRTIAWSSSNAATASVSGTGVVSGVAPGPATITALVEGISGTASVSVTSAPIASITVAPTTASVVEGQTTTLIATARDANGDVLAGRTFFWTSSNASQLSVSQGGVVTAAVNSANALATITASAPGGGAGGSTPSASATVSATFAPVATVTVSPPSQSIDVGQTTPFSATLRASGGQVLSPSGRTVTWTSLNPAIATVNATTGVVTGVAQGGPVTIEVGASSPGQTPVKGTGQVTVSNVPVASVTVTPNPATVHVGSVYQRQFTAVAKDAGGGILGGKTFIWTSNDFATATVDPNTGVVSGVAPGGPVTVTATTESVSGSADVTVDLVPVHSVVVSPASATLDLTTSQTQALAATPLDSAPQQITGTALGGRGTTWNSSDDAIATVSLSGVVTPTGVGTATITADIGGTLGSSIITVTQSVGSVTFAATPDSLILPGGFVNTTVTVNDGNNLPLSGRTVTLTSAPTGFVSIVPLQGTTDALGMVPVAITGVAAGNTTITATSGTKSDNVSMRVLAGMTSISLAPAGDSLFEGSSIAFTATARSGATPLPGRRLAITSSAAQVATVPASVPNTDASGEVAFTLTSKKAGSTLLSISSPEGPSVSRTMRILALAASVEVVPPTVALLQDDMQSFTAVVKDGTNNTLAGRPVVWSSSNPAKLSIDPTGSANALDSGTVTVTGTVTPGTGAGGVATGTSAVTITLPLIATVTIAPATVHVLPLLSVPVTVQVRLNGGAAARGRRCTLASVNGAVATVSPPSAITDQNGDIPASVTGVFLGGTDINATCEGIIGTATVTVP